MSYPIRREADETDRLLALSDGVIAIVITLLVLDLTVPSVPRDEQLALLPAAIAEQWPEFLGFVLSFLVVGFYWVLHRRTFVHIERHDRGVVYLNLCFLLLVAFVPYATSLFTTYPGRFGTPFLSVVLALTGLSLAALWTYADWSEVLDAGLRSRTVQIQAARFLASPAVFALAAVVGWYLPIVGMATWFLLLPINAALQSRLVASLAD
ncbi:TMEM175 family protein [Haloarcula onubensis]|uniref:TMEM175 family protein n=1 Tax=Haloarcula onubensis TaxID=2950539 RepID=A0ABU2FJT2_9EURY|nr:TMEM175 family protein [Halomicroarcula sp. S3CR25-11]MDS0280983.1 TMEM175 family protein [Halomicroarcula sp. S3CR25-11]